MRLLKKIWRVIVKVFALIGHIQLNILLSIFYFSFLLIPGIIYSYLKDELGLKNKQGSFWRKRYKQSETIEDMKKQY